MSHIFSNRYSFRKNKKAYVILGFTLASYLMIHFFRTEGLFDPEWRKIPMHICRNLSLTGILIFIIHVIKKGNWFSSLVQSLCSTLILLIVADMIFLFMLHPPSFSTLSSGQSSEVQTSGSEPSFSYKQLPYSTNMEEINLGFRNRTRDTIFSAVNINGAEEEVYYIFDNYGRRIDRNSTGNSNSKYAIFMGCSVTLGQHVNESRTLPAFFEKMNPDFKSYNYGISASGPNQYLALLQESNLMDQISEEQGVFIYPFFEFHVNRAISDYEAFKWNHMTPYFKLENDELKRDGSFDTGRRILSWIFNILSESYFVEYINFNYPASLSPLHYDYTTRVILEMKKEYMRASGNENFFVFLMPGFETNIIPYLEEYEISYINELESIEEYFGTDYSIPIDQHPTSKFYKQMADSLTSKLVKEGLIEQKLN